MENVNVEKRVPPGFCFDRKEGYAEGVLSSPGLLRSSYPGSATPKRLEP